MHKTLSKQITNNLALLQLLYWVLKIAHEWIFHHYVWLAPDALEMNILFLVTYIVSHMIVFYIHFFFIASLYIAPISDIKKAFSFLAYLIIAVLFISLGRDGIVAIAISEYGLQEQYTFLKIKHISESYFSGIWILVTSGAFFFLYQWRENLQNIERLNDEIEQSKLQFHKAQMSPHFIFNFLNNLCGIAVRIPEQVSPLIQKFKDLMHYNIEQATKDLVPLSDEIEFISHYIQLQQVRLRNELTVLIDIPPPENMNGFYIQPLLLIVFVENIFKHADIEHESNPARVTISIENNTLCYKSINSIDVSPELTTSGIGMHNASTRLTLRYPNTSNITQTLNDSMYSLSVIIPLENKIQEVPNA